jgi:hypothetical protein
MQDQMSAHGYLVLFRHREFRALWTGSAWAWQPARWRV